MSERIGLCVAYNGAGFHGWQYQSPELLTVQGLLEGALSKVADHPVKVICAGRTDARVHATWQVVHFDTDSNRPLKAWVLGTNSHLPDDISVNWAHHVPPEFDARYSATARRYLYLIHNQPLRSPFMSDLLTLEPRPLDVLAMERAGKALVGERDFTSFRAANCQSNSPMRHVHHLQVHRRADVVVIDIAANAFLYHMVRNIAGVLLDVGAGEKPVEWVAELLEHRDRSLGSITAAPNGLYLANVTYPPKYNLPVGPGLPHLFSQLHL